MSVYQLLDVANPHGEHFYRTRRAPLRIGVVHVSAALPEFGFDHNAVDLVRYARSTRERVSWHAVADADGVLELLPPEATALHLKAWNSCTWGLMLAKEDYNWVTAPEPWRTRTLLRGAVELGRIMRLAGIPIKRVGRDALENGRAGVCGHADLEWGQSRDPGHTAVAEAWLDTFPWSEFLAYAKGEGPDLEYPELSWPSSGAHWPLLREGCTGPDVGARQWDMRVAGVPDLVADGVYGPETTKALELLLGPGQWSREIGVAQHQRLLSFVASVQRQWPLVIRRGMTGDYVGWVQHRLVWHGYGGHDLVVSGEFDWPTAGRLKVFQRDHGLTDNGHIDHKTLELLR